MKVDDVLWSYNVRHFAGIKVVDDQEARSIGRKVEIRLVVMKRCHDLCSFVLTDTDVSCKIPRVKMFNCHDSRGA